eukprot:scaffold455339_cov50-Prasinocladus_malaysianus.AAC.1
MEFYADDMQVPRSALVFLSLLWRPPSAARWPAGAAQAQEVAKRADDAGQGEAADGPAAQAALGHDQRQQDQGHRLGEHLQPAEPAGPGGPRVAGQPLCRAEQQLAVRHPASIGFLCIINQLRILPWLKGDKDAEHEKASWYWRARCCQGPSITPEDPNISLEYTTSCDYWLSCLATHSNSASTCRRNSAAHISLLDVRRSSNIEIMLSNIKMGFPELVDAIYGLQVAPSTDATQKPIEQLMVANSGIHPSSTPKRIDVVALSAAPYNIEYTPAEFTIRFLCGHHHVYLTSTILRN